MGKFRLYTQKSNTILEDYPTVNCGKNEVAEIWYGNFGLARWLQSWYVTDYVNRVNSGLCPATTSSTITSCLMTFNTTYPVIESGLTAEDVNLECVYVDKNFTEGSGFDVAYYGDTGVSNWRTATTLSSWTSAGADFTMTAFTGNVLTKDSVFSGSFSSRTTLWSLITANTLQTMVKFAPEYESLSTEEKTLRKFYTRHTNTVLQPYIDITWNDTIKENRNISTGETANLYLFLFKNGVLTDPASINYVAIKTGSSLITTGVTTKVSTGIYKATYTIPTTMSAGTVLTDAWNVVLSGSVTVDFTNTFTATNYTTSGGWSNSSLIPSKQYNISIPKLQDQYKRGDFAYIPVLFREEYSSAVTVHKAAQYRISIKDPMNGNVLLSMYDWTDLSYTTPENFMLIDTSWFITGQTYSIDIRYNDGAATIQSDFNKQFRVEI